MSARAFGRVLKRARAEQNYSQEELGNRARLHRTYISQLERGLKSPTLDTLGGLARALGMSITALVTKYESELRK
jgi:transcriptional regulator with XRE-family HTH domain